jgi:hypothetical protein
LSISGFCRVGVDNVGGFGHREMFIEMALPTSIFEPLEFMTHITCASPLGRPAVVQTGVLKQIFAHLETKAESKEFNPLPESRAPPQGSLFG